MYAEGSSRSSYNTFQDAQEPAHSHNHSHGGSPWKEEHLSVSGRMGEILGGIVDGAVFGYCLVIGICLMSAFDRGDVIMLGGTLILAHAVASYGSNWGNVVLQNERDEVELRMEKIHLQHHPDEEDQHIAALLKDRLSLSDKTVAMIISDAKKSPNGTLRLHSKIELGLDMDAPKVSPFWSGFDRFFSLVLGGAFTLLPYLHYFYTGRTSSFVASTLLTGLLVTSVGAYYSSITADPKKKFTIIKRHLVPTTIGFIVMALLSGILSVIVPLPSARLG